jgi:hypothetical protein
VFPCHGCFFGFGCHIINLCLICCNTTLQKLLSLLSGHNVSPEGESHMMSFLIICEILWHPACAHLYVIQSVIDTLCVHNSAKFPAVRRWQSLNASELSDKGIYMTHIVICSGHAWASCSHLSSTSVWLLL